MLESRFPLAKETINNDDIDALIEWLKGYPRLTKGPLTLEFEKKWAEYIGTKFAVFCNSGSSANLLAFYAMAHGLRNRKVVVPAVGWVTTISPVIQVGFDPIMVDADPETFGINLDHLEDICKKEDPAMVIFVQVLGVPHDAKRLAELQSKYNFKLLEDACAALGSEYISKELVFSDEDKNGNMVREHIIETHKVGTVGDTSTFSFYFGHQLSTIEGGMICTNDEVLYNLMLMLRSHGWGKDLDTQTYDELMKRNGIDDFAKPFTFFISGFNLRATDLQAFIGLRQLEKANWVSRRRYENHVRYTKNLSGYVDFQKFGENKPASISFGAIAKDSDHRRRIVQALMDNRIETRMFSAGNLGLHPFWINLYGEFHGVVADRIHSCGFFVPNFPELELSDIDFICDVIKSA